MRPTADILEDRDRLTQPFVVSCVMHVSLAAVLVASGWIADRPRDLMGAPDASGGGAYQVGSVNTIPILTSQGPPNPLANDTKSQIPEVAKPEVRQAQKAAPEDAIPLKGKKAPSERKTIVRRAPHPAPAELPAVTPDTGPRASSPLFAAAPGSGQVGIGPSAPFGRRFGAYAALIADRVARNWRTDELGPNIKQGPEVVVLFQIQRDGSVRNVRVDQSSGILALDNSAQRAILSAAPFPPLPTGFERDTAEMEIRFQLQR